jgi:biopolymer transport protein ExbD
MSRVRHYKRHEVPPGTFVNLVPLIDVMMQLVLFLMIMGSWNRANQIQLSLPQSSSTVKAAANEADKIMVVTYQLQDGKPSITLDSQPVANLEALGPALQSTGNGKAEPIVNVRIEKSVPYQEVIAVMDAVRDAGFPRFSLLTLEPLRRGK